MREEVKATKRMKKRGFSTLDQRYLAALRVHVRRRRPAGPASGRALGRAILSAGFGPADLAMMHDRALIALAASGPARGGRGGQIERTGSFFAAALHPWEKSHLATREFLERVRRRAETLRLHASALGRANRQLRRAVARRRAGDESLKLGRKKYQVLLAQSQRVQEKLRAVTRQVFSAQEDERREISRELHDEVVQTLVGINVELATLGTAGGLGPRELQARIARTQRLVEKSVQTVHQFARELRPAALDHLGLIPALEIYMERLSARKKLIINLTAFAGIEALETGKRMVLYRVAQEALTNVARHARASTVNMIISELPGAIRMEVNDDGKSFQVLRTLSSRRNKRLGLVGMKERVEMVGGKLEIESAPGQGTSVRVMIPFGPEGAA
jgi:signal transduction histidine kinase